MKAKPRGILWMMAAAWWNPLPGVLWRGRKALPEGRSVARMNKLTLLDHVVWGFWSLAGRGRIGRASRRGHLTGVRDPGVERRHLFGVGEGPAEDVTEAKQALMGMPEICVSFVSVATGKSLLAPLVTHLSTT
jgi:hypothetical protein